MEMEEQVRQAKSRSGFKERRQVKMEKHSDEAIQAFDKLVLDERRKSSGARIDQLNKLLVQQGREEAENHAERLFALLIWWPVVGNFINLIPQFEIRDHNGRQRFIDFVFLVGTILVAIEIDGYGVHAREISRWGFSDERRRQNDLMIEDWYIFRFSYDDIVDAPHVCRQTLLRFFGKHSIAKGSGVNETLAGLKPIQREIVRLARSCDVLSVKLVSEGLGISSKTAQIHLRTLREKCVLVYAFEGRQKVRGYRLSDQYRHK